MNNYIPGSRPGTERQTPKTYSIASLLLKGDEGAALANLYKGVAEKGANCESDPDKWTGDDLPTDREAQAMCSSCPMLKQCRDYAQKFQPAHGVWGGLVMGRDLEEIEKEEADG